MSHIASSRYKKRLQGYTLLEIVSALAAFTLIMLGITQTLGQGIASYRETKKTQINLETAQFALNLIAKELRTSSVVDSSITAITSTIEFYDYSQSRCIQYVLDEGTGQITRRSAVYASADPDQNRTDCANHVFGGASQVLFAGLLDQSGSIITSLPATPDPRVGRITFVLTIGTNANATTLQTSLSFRDYNYTGL